MYIRVGSFCIRIHGSNCIHMLFDCMFCMFSCKVMWTMLFVAASHEKINCPLKSFVTLFRKECFHVYLCMHAWIDIGHQD